MKGFLLDAKFSFKTRHLATQCAKHRAFKSASLWKDDGPQHYSIEKKEENQLNALETSRVERGQEGVTTMEKGSRERDQEGTTIVEEGSREFQLQNVGDLS